jgi:CheY-like chemotaxis protein
VADTGIGIAPADQERIFQEYAQVEGAQQHRAKGTGLGLPLSRKLAQLLGGDVHVKSAVGAGSTFYAVIPIEYRGPTEVSYVPEVTRELDPNRIPVLVVEDNRETLFIYEKYLKGSPYQVIPARSLKDARQALKEIRPLAIVLDILLENEYAWNFLSDVKNEESTRNIPVYVVTMVDNKRKALSMGADDFCLKPVEREWLLERLRALEKGLPQEKVLIIDDDEISRYLVRGLLVDTRFSILETQSGREGLELAHQEKPDVIILDLVMPELDGFAVLQQLKADPKTREIPVIINTSKILSPKEQHDLEGKVVVSLSKHTPSREKAKANMADALAKAGLGSQARESDPASAA